MLEGTAFSTNELVLFTGKGELSLEVAFPNVEFKKIVDMQWVSDDEAVALVTPVDDPSEYVQASESEGGDEGEGGEEGEGETEPPTEPEAFLPLKAKINAVAAGQTTIRARFSSKINQPISAETAELVCTVYVLDGITLSTTDPNNLAFSPGAMNPRTLTVAPETPAALWRFAQVNWTLTASASEIVNLTDPLESSVIVNSNTQNPLNDKTGNIVATLQRKADVRAELFNGDGVSAQIETSVMQYLPEFYIKYNANFTAGEAGGSETISNTGLHTYGQIVSLAENTYTQKGWHFEGWMTSAGGSTTLTNNSALDSEITAALGHVVTNNEVVDVYAKWARNQYTVVYWKNNSTQDKYTHPAPKFQYGIAASLKSLSDTALGMAGYRFDGWALKANTAGVYFDDNRNIQKPVDGDGNAPANNGNLNLYARWTPNTYSVKYWYKNDGTASTNPADTTDSGFTYGTAKALKTLGTGTGQLNWTKANHTFKGWAISPNSTTVAYCANNAAANLSTPTPAPAMSGTLNLYAVWQVFNFVHIQGGTFMMGSPTSETNRDSNETQHSVILSSFYMSKYEVTQKEWRDTMGTSPSNFTGDTLPVENITWFQAVEYCNKRSQDESLTPAYTVSGQNVTWDKSANGYRLPTESEWEYACRAGTTTPFSTGSNITTAQANYDGSRPYNGGAAGAFRNMTTAVGSLAVNAWGLYDMHGNVVEWCWDWSGDYPSGTSNNPEGASSGSDRIIRGGSWKTAGAYVRSAFRTDWTPSNGFEALGFRLVRPE